MLSKLRLKPAATQFTKAETRDDEHSFLHWSIVIFGTLIMSLIFSLVGFLLLFSGFVIFQTKTAWIEIILGLPLILIGVSIIVINLYQTLAAVFDRYYSQTHCPFCRRRDP